MKKTRSLTWFYHKPHWLPSALNSLKIGSSTDVNSSGQESNEMNLKINEKQQDIDAMCS